MPTAIKVENLSKAYQLGEIGTGTLSNDLQRSWARLLGKEDPFLTVGEVNDRTTKGVSDVIWSLKDINFKVSQGDTVGIIGRNGAGKSTLLKLLSRVTAPTTGAVKMKGRIASLLEVGTGFHPDLSGRDNIYLNGAILGMRKAEITRKFDEIVDFSGVERYIDTPVKRYSSGMYVRLAFAVAAHLESEILIIDEVLAVGDAEFQKKCLGKMGEVNKGEGRTILFVSHNMTAIANLCKTGIVLNNGKIECINKIDKSIHYYLSSYKSAFENSNLKKFDPVNDDLFSLLEISAYQKNNSSETFLTSKDTICSITVQFNTSQVDEFVLGFIVYDEFENPIFSTYYDDLGQYKTFDINGNKAQFTCLIPQHFFNEGNYFFEFDLGIANKKRLTNKLHHNLQLSFENIEGVGTKYALGRSWRKSALLPYLTWKTI